jgi:hypothetical protein
MTWMEGRGVSLTPGATMLFGCIGLVYTGPAETAVERTFARPAHPNPLTAARGASRARLSWPMLGPNQTQERFRIAAYYLTNLAF